MESDLIALHSSNYRRDAETVKSALEASGAFPGRFSPTMGGKQEVGCSLSAGAKLIVSKMKCAPSASSN